MNNLEKYDDVFIKTFEIPLEMLNGLEYQEIAKWDSIGHMTLIAMLEDVFDIMMDVDDIIDFDSYKKGKEILKKYDVEV